MKFRPKNCVKCDAELEPPGPRGGRPSRFCCDGCKVSAQAEMSRLQWALRSWEEGDRESRFNNHHTSPLYKDGHERRAAIIAEMRRRYDHLCGVRPRSDDD
jgi:hypothetical protein